MPISTNNVENESDHEKVKQVNKKKCSVKQTNQTSEKIQSRSVYLRIS